MTKFQMNGDVLELYRYLLAYREYDIEMQKYVTSEIEKDRLVKFLNDRNIQCITTSIDQTECEWMNGMKFNSYDDAVQACELGKDRWQTKLFEENPQLQLTAMILDLDYRMSLKEMEA